MLNDEESVERHECWQFLLFLLKAGIFVVIKNQLLYGIRNLSPKFPHMFWTDFLKNHKGSDFIILIIVMTVFMFPHCPFNKENKYSFL